MPGYTLQKVNGLDKLLPQCNKCASKIFIRNKFLQNYYFLIDTGQEVASHSASADWHAHELIVKSGFIIFDKKLQVFSNANCDSER